MNSATVNTDLTGGAGADDAGSLTRVKSWRRHLGDQKPATTYLQSTLLAIRPAHLASTGEGMRFHPFSQAECQMFQDAYDQEMSRMETLDAGFQTRL